MKRRRERSRRMRTLRLWDWSEVVKAVPYLRSVIGSLREHWLEVLNAERHLSRLAQHKAPVGRRHLIEEQAGREERHRAQTKFEDALAELNRIDVFLLDP